MGEYYIKTGDDGEEHVYEKGVFWDIDHGKLHENLDGSKETRTISGPEITVEQESYSGEREATIDGVEGVFTKHTPLGFTAGGMFDRDYPEFDAYEEQEEDISEVDEDLSNTSSPDLETPENYKPRNSLEELAVEPPRTEEASYKELPGTPWQLVAGEIFNTIGLKKLSNFFYSAASHIYLYRGDYSTSAHLAAKAGDIEFALTNLLNSSGTNKDWCYEARRIAEENNSEEKLLQLMEERGKWESAGRLAHNLDLQERAIKNYELAAITSNVKTSVKLFGEAGSIAAEIGDLEKAVELYRKAGDIGTAQYDKKDLNTFFHAENFLKKAKDLEKSYKRKKKPPTSKRN